MKHFLSLSDLTQEEHLSVAKRAVELKARRAKRQLDRTLEGRTLALLFEKASTRTRVSFEAAITQLGGSAVTLPYEGSQLARGEPLSDTARVVSRYADAIVFRTSTEARLHELTQASSVPVINGLTDAAHPVQLLADLMTVEERFGSLAGRVVAFVGDGSSNMARSWVEAAGLFGFSLRIGAPRGFWPPDGDLTRAGGHARVHENAVDAVRDAEVVATDVWTSMGQEDEAARRRHVLRGFSVTSSLLESARPEAIVLHCLPAHRGEEIAADVLEGPRSAAWDEAENRLHVQKALLEQLILR